MADAVRMVLTIVSVAVILAVGVSLSGAIVDTSPEDAGEQRLLRQPAELSGGDYYELESTGTGTDETVRNTTGYELQLQGENDSDFAFDKGLETGSSDNYTVCTFAKVNTSTSARQANRTLVTAGGDVTISYRNATGGDQWHVFIYDPESRTSIQFTGPANNETNRGQVCAWRDGSDVRLYRNASRIANETFDESGSANANLTTANWHGTVEETRFFGDPLNSTQRNDTFNNATAPLRGANRTDRIYYDAGQGNSVYAFLSPNEPQAATIGGNYSWQQTGFQGAVMSENGDYNWQEDPPAVKREGGDLSSQPAAWVDYTSEGVVTRVAFGIASAMNAASVIIITLGAAVVMVGVRFLNA